MVRSCPSPRFLLRVLADLGCLDLGSSSLAYHTTAPTARTIAKITVKKQPVLLSFSGIPNPTTTIANCPTLSNVMSVSCSGYLGYPRNCALPSRDLLGLSLSTAQLEVVCVSSTGSANSAPELAGAAVVHLETLWRGFEGKCDRNTADKACWFHPGLLAPR